MTWVLRALVLLAATAPVFAATQFHPVWWQIVIAAAAGSALGQLAVRFARGRIARGAVLAAAAIVIGATVAWTFRGGRPAPPKDSDLVVRSHALTWDDLDQIRTLPGVKQVVPYLQSHQQVASDDQNWNTDVVGTTREYLDIVHGALAEGSGFVPDGGKLVVLGGTVAQQLFGKNDPVGQTVRIHGYPYEVVGLLAHRGTAPGGQDLDDVVLMAVETYQRKITGGYGHLLGGVILIAPDAPEDLPRLEEAVRNLLRERHHVAESADDDLTIHAATL